MRRRRKAAGFVVAAALMISWLGCARSTSIWNDRGGPPRVVVTIPALDNFVRNIGGNHVAVACLCTTQGPHHYQYNAQDAILLREADLFFAIGLTLDEKFADPIQIESHNPNLQYIKLGERLPKTMLQPFHKEHEHGKEEAHEHEHKHDHEHGEHDPHVWLGIPQAIALVGIIRDELKQVDPKNAADYDANAADYVKKLKELHAYGKNRLKDKKNRKIIAFHESLGYFAKSFDVDIVATLEEIPGAQAGQAHMAKVAEECLAKDVRAIAVEPQYPTETSARLLRDTLKGKHKEIAFVAIDPLETVAQNHLKGDGKELKSPKWYEDEMRRNLDNLAKGLP